MLFIDRKIIAFVGIEKQDLLIYLASILYCMQYKVAIFDQSDKQLLQYCTAKSEGDFDRITYRGIEYVFSKSIKKEDYEPYDIILVDLGEWVTKENIGNFSKFYIVTDNSRYHVEKSIGLLLEIGKKTNVIFKNMCECKINKEYLVEDMKRKKITLGKTYEVKFDLIDYEYEIRMQYEPYQEFKSLSKGYENLLCSLIVEFTEVNIVTIKKAFKKARKGAFHCK